MKKVILTAALFLAAFHCAEADEHGIPNTNITSIPCQIIETSTETMTVCVKKKPGTVEAFSAACNAIEAGLCWSNGVTTAPMGLALPLVKLAKDRGAFRDLGECEEIARDSGRLGGVLASVGAGDAGRIAGILAGICAECVCRAAY